MPQRSLAQMDRNRAPCYRSVVNRAVWLWAALILPLWIVFTLCTYWEPVVRDSWGPTLWHYWNDVTPSTVAEFIRHSYVEANPRFGQTLTLLLFTPGPWHVIFTPIAELGLFALLTTMALGRWPSIKRADDALVFATATAIVAIAAPQFGPMLFYRPFTGNYTFGLILNLSCLVPYRLHAEVPRRWRAWWSPLLFVLGLAAGMCNEHTGTAFVSAAAFAIVIFVRRGERIRPWMIAGVLGLALGYVLLLLAPGQNVRYNGLATEAGMLARIADRGVVENIEIITRLGTYLAVAAPWILLGILARWIGSPAPISRATRLSLVVLVAGGLVSALTLLASPKLGPRLYLASVALIAVAITGWVTSQLSAGWSRRVCAVMAAGVLAFVAWKCVVTYRVVGEVSATRLAVIRKGPFHTHVVVPRYPVPANRWFLGEDFDLPAFRAAMASDYGLAGIELAPEPR